ncbi:hypothetical protein FQA47_024776 [Oryzias melastigma]|uniref:Uncharacterized protein n=1 Tax=Oryzias melastigma TaxID=30732 RepID=A0A834CRH7_ORYME|nr:hypothetical protein FQA47_024776 [Oryzias melastigma]
MRDHGSSPATCVFTCVIPVVIPTETVKVSRRLAICVFPPFVCVFDGYFFFFWLYSVNKDFVLSITIQGTVVVQQIEPAGPSCNLHVYHNSTGLLWAGSSLCQFRRNMPFLILLSSY